MTLHAHCRLPPPSLPSRCILQGLAVVPDCHRPFTITMHNPCDDLDYVVAHYEPHALQHATLSSSSSSSSSSSNSSRRGSGGPAADLCEVFYSRKSHLLLQRTSAASEIGSGQDAESTLMAMAGTRNPTTGGGRHAHLSRYHDDLGKCCAGCFCWHWQFRHDRLRYERGWSVDFWYLAAVWRCTAHLRMSR
jgi:hypothetical protein